MRIGLKHERRVGPASHKVQVLIDNLLRIDRIVTAIDEDLGRGRQMPNQIFALSKIGQDIAMQIMLANERDGADRIVGRIDGEVRREQSRNCCECDRD